MANDVQVRMSAEDAGMVRAWQEARRGVAEFAQELDNAGNKAKRAGKQSDEAFGGAMIAKYATAAAAIGLIKSAIDKTTEAWTAYMERQKEALDSAKNIDQSSRKLSQIAAGDPAKLQQLHAQRDAMAVKYGIDREQVADAIFNAQSAGLSDAELETGLKGTMIGDDVDQATKYMGSVKQAFKSDPKQAYNVALQAAADAAKLEMKDVTGGLPDMLPAAKMLGMGIEDTASILSETSAGYATGSDAATGMKRLLGKLSMHDEFKGQGMAGLEKFTSQTEAEWDETIGKDEEPRRAARILKEEMADIKAGSERYKGIAAATGTKDDLLTKAVDTHLSDKENAAVHKINQLNQELEVKKEQNYATGEAAREAAVTEEAIRMQDEKPGFLSEWFSGLGTGAAKWAGASPSTIEHYGQMGSNLGAGPAGWERNAQAGMQGWSSALGVRLDPTMDAGQKTQEEMLEILRGIQKNTADKTVKLANDPSVPGGVAAPGLGDWRDGGGDF